MTAHNTEAGQALNTQCYSTFSCGKGDKQWGGGHSGSKNVGLSGTHPTKVAKTLQDLLVKEAGLGRVRQGLVQEVVNEVDAWLHSQHHAWLQVPCRTQASQARFINALYTLWKEERWGNPTDRHRAGYQGHCLIERQPDRTSSSAV